MHLATLLDRNRRWVAERTRHDPEYFRRMSRTHEPHWLWIGCSDARVPANVVTGTQAGEMFVHRNIANQVVGTDNNLLAVVQYAVEVLGVSDIIVCGHEGCGGVKAALGPLAPAHVEGWLTHVRGVARLHAEELAAIPDEDERVMRLVELNVREQVFNLARLPVIQSAWASGQSLGIHGWVYRLTDGLLRDLHVTLDDESPTLDPSPLAEHARRRRDRHDDDRIPLAG
jgi:carbonic anhydrase